KRSFVVFTHPGSMTDQGRPTIEHHFLVCCTLNNRRNLLHRRGCPPCANETEILSGGNKVTERAAAFRPRKMGRNMTLCPRKFRISGGAAAAMPVISAPTTPRATGHHDQ